MNVAFFSQYIKIMFPPITFFYASYKALSRNLYHSTIDSMCYLHGFSLPFPPGKADEKELAIALIKML